jgi:hypothetical protein
MRFISRGALLALGAALVMSALATASASASECPGTGEGVALCSGGHVQLGSFAFTSKRASGSTELVFEYVGLLRITCTTSKGSGELVATTGHVEVVKDVIEWTGCSIAANPACKVSPFRFGMFGGLKGSFALVGTLAEITVTGAENEKFGEIHITGCELEREGTIKGTQKCSISKATSEAATHEFLCQSANSKLHIASTSVSINSHEEISLTSGNSYSLQRS